MWPLGKAFSHCGRGLNFDMGAWHGICCRVRLTSDPRRFVLRVTKQRTEGSIKEITRTGKKVNNATKLPHDVFVVFGGSSKALARPDWLQKIQEDRVLIFGSLEISQV